MLSKARRMSTKMKVVSAVIGVLLASVGAYAATNWVVGLNAGSSGEGQSSEPSPTCPSPPSPPRLRATSCTRVATETWW